MATDILKDVGLGEDPGWRSRSGDLLVNLRRLMIVFVSAIVLIGVVVVTLGDQANTPGPTVRSIAVVVAAGVSSLVMQAFVRPMLDCASARTLATSYRERFFLRLALSESTALIAFVVYMVWGPTWVYFIGAAFTLVGFWRLAPTRRSLQRDQDQLSLNGCQLSLVAALRTPAS